MSEYKLTTELLKLSNSTVWSKAKLEWELADVEMVTTPEECLCGHFPIVEVCTIFNTKTNLTARVGNSCVKKFNNKSDKIFRSIAKIKKNNEKSVNVETIEFAFEKKWINDWEYNFYLDILKKKKISEKILIKKKSINNKITARINKS